MKTIWLPNNHTGENLIGGGFSFIRNLKEVSDIYVESPTYVDCDGVLIAGATMIKPEEVQVAKDKGKKIIFRIDNMPRNSRNRGTAFNRVKAFYEMADIIVFQSKWARDYIAPFFGKKKSVVILNGCNQDIFNPHANQVQRNHQKKIYLYSRHNRDETKRWEETWYDYQLIHRKAKEKPVLWICGKFSQEQIDYNFDFFNDEITFYWGDVADRILMAGIYASADKLLMPYYNDGCSNTLIEAISSGLKVECNTTGGNKEILLTPVKELNSKRMEGEYRVLYS